MSCVNPYVRIDEDFFKSSSYKHIFEYLPRKKPYRGGYFFKWDDFFSVFDNYCNRDKLLANDKVSLIPCGSCMPCLLKHSKDWSMRVAIESERFEYNYFLTLTYNDDNIKRDIFRDKEKNIYDLPYLDKKDLQLFIKNLRYYLGDDMKYFACGEYGNLNLRPHYHLIIMSHKEIPKLKFIYNDKDNIFFNSDIISKIWEYGYHTLSECNMNTIFYTSHYCLKKAGSRKVELWNSDGKAFQNEFQLMSRSPGLATDFFYKKVVPNYLDLTTFKYKDYSIDIKSLKFFDYMFHKKDFFMPWKLKKEKTSDMLLYQDKYMTKYDIANFKQNVINFDKLTFRDKI